MSGALDWLPTKTGQSRKSNNRSTSKSLEYINLLHQSFFAVKTSGSFIDSSKYNLRSVYAFYGFSKSFRTTVPSACGQVQIFAVFFS